MRQKSEADSAHGFVSFVSTGSGTKKILIVTTNPVGPFGPDGVGFVSPEALLSFNFKAKSSYGVRMFD